MSKITTTHAAVTVACMMLILLLSAIFKPISSTRKPNTSYMSMIDTSSKPISKPVCVKPAKEDAIKPRIIYSHITDNIIMQGKLIHIDDQLVSTEYKFISLLAYIINNPEEYRNKEDSFISAVSRFNKNVNTLHTERNSILDSLKSLN